MAKRRKRRRPKAGPQPVRNPRREVKATTEKGSKQVSERRRPGEPRPVSYKGIAMRAAIVAALFYPYLIYIGGETTAIALLWTVIAFAIMMPLGIAIDHARYRIQRKRYEQRVSGAP
jgi:hypothetical protein